MSDHMILVTYSVTYIETRYMSHINKITPTANDVHMYMYVSGTCLVHVHVHVHVCWAEDLDKGRGRSLNTERLYTALSLKN